MIQHRQCGIIGGMSFAVDFVGVSDSIDQSQKLIDVVYNYCNKWRLKANVTKSVVWMLDHPGLVSFLSTNTVFSFEF